MGESNGQASIHCPQPSHLTQSTSKAGISEFIEIAPWGHAVIQGVFAQKWQ